ncbi:hypothetical protein CTI12_AA471140 [Artemisia annua]|uniref:Uncharacterized protein n=1 Tax=Artemisia annua TaxID=35608 RepID=A0A2U1LNR2_ARTAN|nr:hypothetical protein CTI12_AA471140 [Artemisia annua]
MIAEGKKKKRYIDDLYTERSGISYSTSLFNPTMSAPSFSATVRPGASNTSSSSNTRSNKPVSMQYKLSDGPPPSISQAGKHENTSNNVDPPKEAGGTDKPISLDALAHADKN